MTDRVAPASPGEVDRLEKMTRAKRIETAYMVPCARTGKPTPFKMMPWHHEILDAHEAWIQDIESRPDSLKIPNKIVVVRSSGICVTTFISILMLDYMSRKNYFHGYFLNYTQDEDRLMARKVISYICRKSPYLVAKDFHAKSNSVEIKSVNSEIFYLMPHQFTFSSGFFHLAGASLHSVAHPRESRFLIQKMLGGSEYSPVIFEGVPYGNTGWFADMAKRAWQDRKQGKPITRLDPNIVFIGWWQNPANRVRIPPGGHEFEIETSEYFEDLNCDYNLEFTEEQMLWHEKTRIHKFSGLMHRMIEEYPSCMDECFRNPPRLIMEEVMERMKKEKRYRSISLIKSKPCYVFWDFGFNKSPTVILVAQRTARKKWAIIDFYQNRAASLAPFLEHLQNMGYKVASHIFPHDGDDRSITARGLTREETTLAKYFSDVEGISNIEIIPRISNKESGFRISQAFAGKVEINQDRCAELYENLRRVRRDAYRDGTPMSRLRKGLKGNDAYDAFELLARKAQECR